jgi:Spy/CpxP family protein refolding chaperone
MGMGGGFGSGNCGLQGAAVDALGLDAGQRERIAAILDDSSARRLALMESMHEVRSQAVRTGNRDYAAMANVRERMLAEARDRQARIDAVLTPDQRARLHGGWGGFGPRG